MSLQEQPVDIGEDEKLLTECRPNLCINSGWDWRMGIKI